MARRTAEFRLGHLGAAYNSYRYTGPAPLNIDESQDQFSANYARPLADSGVRNS